MYLYAYVVVFILRKFNPFNCYQQDGVKDKEPNIELESAQNIIDKLIRPKMFALLLYIFVTFQKVGYYIITKGYQQLSKFLLKMHTYLKSGLIFTLSCCAASLKGYFKEV